MTSNNNTYDAVVIGGGHNGLTAAALLAKAGRKVVLLERRPVLGGSSAREEFHAGYHTVGVHHDTACVRPEVVDNLNLKTHGLRFQARPPSVFAPQPPGGGPGLLLHDRPEDSAAEIGAHSSKDAARFARYRAFFARIKRFTGRVFAEPPPSPAPGASSTLRLLGDALALRRLGRKDMAEVLRIGAMCVADWLNEWFECDLLKGLLAAPALHGEFAGPWSPGTNGNLVRREAAIAAVVSGGPAALIDALARAARANGVEIRTNAEAAAVRVSAGAVNGVTLTDGDTIDSPLVAASCDPKRTFLRLLAGGDIGMTLAHRIEKMRMRGTTAKVNLALSAPLRFDCRPDLQFEHARTAQTLNEIERAFDSAKYGAFSAAPALDICDVTAADSSSAPQGHRTVSIIAHYAPYELCGGWTDESRARLGEAILAALERFAPDFRQLIVHHEVLTPADIESRYGLTGGQINHGEHGLDQLIVRPCPECAHYATPINGLYLCGSGSHPGGGLTCAPGALGANAILKPARPARRTSPRRV